MGYGTTDEDDEDAPGGEPLARREPLVRAAAMQVGMIVFAFSRLDMHLALALRRTAEEAGDPAAAGPGEGSDFADRLQRLQALADGMEPGERRQAWQGWIAQCQSLDILRPAFVHGHWLPDVRTGRVVNMVAGGTGELSYSLQELDAVIAQIDSLRLGLQALRGLTAVEG